MAFVLWALPGSRTKRRRGPRAAVAKLPYAGVNRIRFEGSVSTAPRRYPRFGDYCTMSGATRQTGMPARRPDAGLTGY